MGSGSNLLIADAGVRGLVLKLDQELTQITVDGTRIDCGGGARLPAVSAQAARAGLSGIEFGVNIPGTVGGAVRMNANAYGGELARALEWVDVTSAAGTARRTPDELGFAYRRSGLQAGEVVARAAFALAPLPPEDVKRTLGEMRSKRRAAQPSGIKTFGSTFKNPTDPRAEGRTAGQLLEAAGARGLRVGGAGLLGQARQLRREPRGRHHRRRRGADGGGPPAREGALRSRARARGPDARTGVVPGRLGTAMSSARARSAPLRLARRRLLRRLPRPGLRALAVVLAILALAAGGLGVAAQLVPGRRQARDDRRGQRPRRAADPRRSHLGRAQHDDARREAVRAANRGRPVPGGQAVCTSPPTSRIAMRIEVV